jgi:hypothetical protein
MPKCEPCLSFEIKEAIRSKIKDPKIIAEIDAIPDCILGTNVELCLSGVKKRGRSKYQQFISECMKARNIHSKEGAANGMKECAAEWRKIKATI